MARCISGYVYTGECAILDLFPSPLYVIESVNKTLNRYRAVTNHFDFVLKQGHFKDDKKYNLDCISVLYFSPLSLHVRSFFIVLLLLQLLYVRKVIYLD